MTSPFVHRDLAADVAQEFPGHHEAEQYLEQYNRSQNQQYLLGQTQYAIQNAMNRSREAVNAAVQGPGFVMNPMQLGSVFGVSLGTQQGYESLTKQNRAGFQPGVFSLPQINAAAPALQSMGFNKGDLQSYMRQMSTLSLEVSKNLDKATQSVMAFAKANGMDVGQTVALTGLMVGSTDLSFDNPSGITKVLAQLKGMGGGNGALTSAYQQAYLQMAAVVNQSGQSGTSDNITRVMEGFRRMDPKFFGQAGGVQMIAQMNAQTSNFSEMNPLMLLRSQQRLRAYGRSLPNSDPNKRRFMSADLITTGAELENNNPVLRAGNINDLGSGGLGLWAFLTHQMSAGTLDMYRRNRGKFAAGVASGAPYNPLDTVFGSTVSRAQEATTAVDKANAQLINALDKNSGLLHNLNSTMAALMPNGPKSALAMGLLGGAVGGAASIGGTILGFKIANKGANAFGVFKMFRRARKVAGNGVGDLGELTEEFGGASAGASAGAAESAGTGLAGLAAGAIDATGYGAIAMALGGLGYELYTTHKANAAAAGAVQREQRNSRVWSYTKQGMAKGMTEAEARKAAIGRVNQEDSFADRALVAGSVDAGVKNTSAAFAKRFGVTGPASPATSAPVITHPTVQVVHLDQPSIEAIKGPSRALNDAVRRGGSAALQPRGQTTRPMINK